MRHFNVLSAKFIPPSPTLTDTSASKMVAFSHLLTRSVKPKGV
jgi:hypothetical protein